MTRILPVIFWASFFAVPALCAEPHFLATSAINIVELLPPPPLAGSAAATADMDAVLKAQITRTDAEVARGKSEVKLSPTAFQSVLGPDFTDQNFPHIFALLDDVGQDSKLFSTKAKDIFARPRPKFADLHVRPAVDGDDDPAYPSGHATRGMLWARILCEIAPEKKDALLDRGEEIGWDRVIIGVHYPSDVYAGEVLGQGIARHLRNNEEFQTRLTDAKEEFRSHGAPRPVAATAP
jgi:membrane-associated phospholipid phosphatase